MGLTGGVETSHSEVSSPCKRANDQLLPKPTMIKLYRQGLRLYTPNRITRPPGNLIPAYSSPYRTFNNIGPGFLGDLSSCTSTCRTSEWAQLMLVAPWI